MVRNSFVLFFGGILSTVLAFNTPFLHINNQHEKYVICTKLYAQVPSSSSPSTTSSSKPKKKKQKKNKYAKFSQADNLSLDPLDALMKESQSKLTELHQEEESKTSSARRISSRRRKSNDMITSSLEAVDQLLQPIDDEDIIQEEEVLTKEYEKRERGKRYFPDTKSIDPYDPTTYGYIELGTIIGAHGVHGMMKLTTITDFAQHRLCNPGIRHIKPPNRRSPREVYLVEGRPTQSATATIGTDNNPTYLIRLEDVNDREDALKMRGCVLYSLAEEKVDDLLEENEYIVSDLIGMNVYLDETIELHSNKGFEELFVGNIKGVVMGSEMCAIPCLGQDLLEVVLPSKKKSEGEDLVLVPFVPEIVSRVDLDGRLISIIPPEGLLDLAYRREEKIRIKGLLPPARS